MRPLDQFPMFELGAAMQQLRAMLESDKTDSIEQLRAFFTADTALERLLKGEQLNVVFCKDAALTLHREIRSSIRYFHDDEKGYPDATKSPLPPWRMYTIRNGLDVFEHQLSGELKGMAAYAVPERGIFSTRGLVDSADRHIHETVREAVPEFARAEFRRAGRSLAFGLYSASGFHSARAVENMLRIYFTAFFGEPDKDDIGLGLMASHLEELRKRKDKPARLPKENTVRHLRDFASYDRNPLIHKTVDLAEIDAVTLFNGALSVIVEMAKELGTIQGDTEAEPQNAMLSRSLLPPPSASSAPSARGKAKQS